MSWGIIFLTAVLFACVLAGPAAAGIKRYTDSQGVIRITNVGPPAPRQIQAESPAAVPGPPKTSREITNKPEAGPRLATAAQAPLGEQVNAPAKTAKPTPFEQARTPSTLESSLLYLPSNPQQVTNVPPALGNPENIRPPVTAIASGALPLQKVAYEQGGAGPQARAGRAIPGEQINAPVAPEISEISFPVMWPEPQLSWVPEVPENQEITRTPDTETAPGPLLVQKAAYDPESTGAALPPAPQLASLLKPEPGPDGAIHSFRDRQGVLVITNVGPRPTEAATRLQQASNERAPDKIVLEEKLGQPGTVPGAPNLRQVSYNPEQPAMGASPVAAGSARFIAAAPSGTIRRYKDKDGVLHIENVGVGVGESPGAPAALARAGTTEATGATIPRRSPPGKGPGDQLALKPAAHSVGAAKPPALNLAAADSLQEEIGAAVGVQRYRDRLGIWQIKTGKDHWIMEAPPLMRPGAGPREVLLAVFDTAARLPEATRPPQVVAPRLPQVTELSEVAWVPGPAVPQEPSPKYRGIAALRDKRGVLTITNAQPQVPVGNGQSWALASAQLEPIIQEAARAYQLPPTLIRAVIKVESNFVHLAVSTKGAMGLMQLMPGTAQFLGVQEPFNPRENIHGGCRYLRMLIDSFGGSLPLALAAYNAGPQRVINSGYRVPEITETQDFLTQVIGRYLTEEKKVRRPWT